jgi:hypothetical protein
VLASRRSTRIRESKVPALFYYRGDQHHGSENSSNTSVTRGSEKNVPRFRALFCELTNTVPENYQAALFDKTLYFHACIVARLFLYLWPEIFREDFEVIRELADVTCAEIFEMEVSRFDGRNKRASSNLRRLCLIAWRAAYELQGMWVVHSLSTARI